jgi:alkylation response protein AidB-like acyl-CoA dehydrogenase
VLGSAAQKFGAKVQEQQEVLAAASDMIMDVYAMESGILRTEKLIAARGEQANAVQIDATRVFANDAIFRIEQNARQAMAAMSEGDELRTMLAVLKRYMRYVPFNTFAARRRIADALVENGRYFL